MLLWATTASLMRRCMTSGLILRAGRQRREEAASTGGSKPAIEASDGRAGPFRH